MKNSEIQNQFSINMIASPLHAAFFAIIDETLFGCAMLQNQKPDTDELGDFNLFEVEDFDDALIAEIELAHKVIFVEFKNIGDRFIKAEKEIKSFDDFENKTKYLRVWDNEKYFKVGDRAFVQSDGYSKNLFNEDLKHLHFFHFDPLTEVYQAGTFTIDSETYADKINKNYPQRYFKLAQ